MKRPVDTETLKQFFCFIELTQEEARVVAGLLGKIDLKSGQTLFRRGDACTAVYGRSADTNRRFEWISTHPRDAWAGSNSWRNGAFDQ
jgi:hypothetical protein